MPWETTKPNQTEQAGASRENSSSAVSSVVRRLGQFQHNTFSGSSLLSHYRSWAPVAAVILAVVMVALGILVSVLIQSSLEDLTRQSLKNILEANVRVLETWTDDQKGAVSRVAASPQIQIAAGGLVEESMNKFEWLPANLSDHSSLAALQAEIPDDPRYIGWCVIRLDRMVVAASEIELVGKELAVRQDALDQIAKEQPALCHAVPSPTALLDEGPLSITGGPVMAAMAPITQDDRPVGALMLLMDPADQFTRLMSIANWGWSGESYAFDSRARLLSQSRFESELREANLLPTDTRVSSILTVSLRTPPKDSARRNQTHSGDPASSREEWPLTLMADEAIRGGTGENMDGYPSYRDTRVVGVWTWLAGQQLGIATEISTDEAYRPLRLLKRLFIVLMVITVLASVALLAMTFLGRIGTRGSARSLDSSRRLGQYELGKMLGKGGMGAVYRASHHSLQRAVAIKVLEAEKSNELTITRFEREVQMTARLRHPNTIEIYDYGRTDKGTFYYVMEHINGISMQELVDQFGGQPAGRVIHLLLQVCGALSEAHHLGLIHRDIKPANLLICQGVAMNDHVKVLDFGLIKQVQSDQQDQSLTRVNSITGTPMYMSPEAVRDAGTIHESSDLYSLGAVGYALLCGQPIFDGTGSVDICMKQLQEDPIRPSDRCGLTLSEDLQNVLMSCLRKSPEERPASADDLAMMLRSCQDFGTWDDADALQWWDMTYRAHLAQQAQSKPSSQSANTRDGTRTKS